MYSRFITWQKNPTFSSLVKSSDLNQFVIDDESMDVRFALKGYGFKKVGEQNRIVHHFGCYKCFYRKIGDTEWTLFSHVTSARESSEESNVYKDIVVTSGALAQGKYEVKIVACRLIELENWSSGIVEGIASGDQFFYDLQARQNLPNRIRVYDDIEIEDYRYISFDVITMLAGIEFEEVTYAIDIVNIDLMIEFSIDETVLVEENFNAQET